MGRQQWDSRRRRKSLQWWVKGILMYSEAVHCLLWTKWRMLVERRLEGQVGAKDKVCKNNFLIFRFRRRNHWCFSVKECHAMSAMFPKKSCNKINLNQAVLKLWDTHIIHAYTPTNLRTPLVVSTFRSLLTFALECYHLSPWSPSTRSSSMFFSKKPSMKIMQ